MNRRKRESEICSRYIQPFSHNLDGFSNQWEEVDFLIYDVGTVSLFIQKKIPHPPPDMKYISDGSTI